MENSVCIAPPPTSRVAFVTGANGISDHALIEHSIRNPKQEWSQIIITSRRPPKACWYDLRDPHEEIMRRMKNDPAKLPETNCPLFYKFLEAVDAARPRLQRLSLQTGGKHYGIQFQGFDFPCHEDTSRYRGPGDETLFYYKQEDDLFAVQQRNKRWHYNIIRPFGIVGFTSQFSGMNEALCIAQYFIICRELGQPPKWPGNYNGWYQVKGIRAPSVADMHVWAATNERARDQAFNHGNGDAAVWRFLWTLFRRYFVLPSGRRTREWWEQITQKYGGNGEAFQARRFGWYRIYDSHEAWVSTFCSYENAGILPRPQGYQGSG
ncbi:hypothetical protein BDV11DRAFT_210134 [Aspergillus similis]